MLFTENVHSVLNECITDMVSNLYTEIIGLKTKKLKHTYVPMKTMNCLSQVMDVVDFIVNLYNVRSVRICAK